jgi:hypothetical protein
MGGDLVLSLTPTDAARSLPDGLRVVALDSLSPKLRIRRLSTTSIFSCVPLSLRSAKCLWRRFDATTPNGRFELQRIK